MTDKVAVPLDARETVYRIVREWQGPEFAKVHPRFVNALIAAFESRAAVPIDVKWDKSGLKEACQRALKIGRTHQEIDIQLMLDMLLEIERLETIATALTTTPATSEAQTCIHCGHRESRQIPKQCVDDECFCVCVFPDTTPTSGAAQSRHCALCKKSEYDVQEIIQIRHDFVCNECLEALMMAANGLPASRALQPSTPSAMSDADKQQQHEDTYWDDPLRGNFKC